VFWNVILAHLVGDFALQPDWMVRNRHKFWVPPLHGVIHFGLMVLLVGSAREAIWPYLLMIAVLHVGQDIGKRYLTTQRPDLTVPLFLLDQVSHLALIGVAVWLLAEAVGSVSLAQVSTWALIAVAYLFVTYVWFVSERLFNLPDTNYVNSINKTKYSRMFVRASVLSLFLLLQSASLPLISAILISPYPQAKYRARAVLADLGVSFVGILFLWLALG
jgi:hypothetical protein